MLKCNFNKVAKQHKSYFDKCVLLCKFAAHFQYNFLLELLWRTTSEAGNFT